jgi:hypothetical protein
LTPLVQHRVQICAAQASPALGAFYRGMRVATAGLLGLCPPATNRCVCAARYARLPIDDANGACFDPAR